MLGREIQCQSRLKVSSRIEQSSFVFFSFLPNREENCNLVSFQNNKKRCVDTHRKTGPIANLLPTVQHKNELVSLKLRNNIINQNKKQCDRDITQNHMLQREVNNERNRRILTTQLAKVIGVVFYSSKHLARGRDS